MKHLLQELASLSLVRLVAKIHVALETVVMKYLVWAIMKMTIAGYSDKQALANI
jgi:hypothetical protein